MSGVNKNSMLRVIRVDTFHDGSMEIVLSNGNYFVVEIKYVLELPDFEILAEDDRFFEPMLSEDGSAIYWRDGPRPIGVDELLALISKTDGEENGGEISNTDSHLKTHLSANQ